MKFRLTWTPGDRNFVAIVSVIFALAAYLSGGYLLPVMTFFWAVSVFKSLTQSPENFYEGKVKARRKKRFCPINMVLISSFMTGWTLLPGVTPDLVIRMGKIRLSWSELTGWAFVAGLVFYILSHWVFKPGFVWFWRRLPRREAIH